MRRRQPPTRRAPWALWVFALGLLLKAAVPLLAVASAHAQGRTLVEVCTVYGVATVALDAQDGAPQSGHATPLAGEHCALTALAAFTAPGEPAAPLPAPTQAGPPALALHGADAPDASAAWAARLRHGPPSVS